jgi:hypothetical protein
MDKTHKEVDKMIAALPNLSEVEALEVANRLLRQEVAKISEERNSLRDQLNQANMSLINIAKVITSEIEKINNDYIGFQQYPDRVAGDADLPGSPL